MVEIFVFGAVGVLITKGARRFSAANSAGVRVGLADLEHFVLSTFCRFEKPRAGYLMKNFFEILFNTFFHFGMGFLTNGKFQ